MVGKRDSLFDILQVRFLCDGSFGDVQYSVRYIGPERDLNYRFQFGR